MRKAQKDFSIMSAQIQTSLFHVDLQNAPDAPCMFTRLQNIKVQHNENESPLSVAATALAIAKELYPQYVSRLMVFSAKPIRYSDFEEPAIDWTEYENNQSGVRTKAHNKTVLS